MPLDEVDFAGELAVIESEILGVLARAGVIAVDGDRAVEDAPQSSGSEPGPPPAVVTRTGPAAPTAPGSTTTTTTTTTEPPASEPAPAESPPTTSPDEPVTTVDAGADG